MTADVALTVPKYCSQDPAPRTVRSYMLNPVGASVNVLISQKRVLFRFRETGLPNGHRMLKACSFVQQESSDGLARLFGSALTFCEVKLPATKKVL